MAALPPQVRADEGFRRSGRQRCGAPKPARRGRKKSDTSSASSVKKVATTTSSRSRKKSKAPAEEQAAAADVGVETKSEEEGDEDFDDGMDFPYDWPPLVCCYGAAQREFIPTVRVSDRQMHPDQYSSWKGLQWNPPEFVRAPGGPPSNVAIAHVRLGGRAAFMGKVGDDDYGRDLVYTMNLEKVQTRAVKIDSSVKTATSHMKISFQGDGSGKMVAETIRDCAEDALRRSELNVSVLKEARIFHFNSAVLMSPSMRPRCSGGSSCPRSSAAPYVGVDPGAWGEADVVELTKQELEFLLDEEHYERRRNYQPQYFSESVEQTKNRRDYYHYTREEIAPLWHQGMKILFVTDGTLRVHYYTPAFDGVVIGTEDVLITPFTCDRTGSGDALVAGLLRKLAIHPEMYEDQHSLERHIRFAIAAGIIAQWTVGGVRGFPTESATQNLKEQVYVPSMW
ncbi:unnamed protein product [Spirodela intermedia]|uniref:Carbohydrate kinase PfkB domain-containing protein n=1 Tax=Spirodela intermedia TaxID=51605 RepID=A0A7I8IFS8_SPIIN|nr:unnamed protein product [Spirodela intermedia]CAA6656760.1 unnamed protein product [Spirodela intermedia]